MHPGNGRRASLSQKSWRLFWEGIIALWGMLAHRRRKIQEIFAWLLVVLGLEFVFIYFIKIITDVIGARNQIDIYVLSLLSAFLLLRLGINWLISFVKETKFLRTSIYLDNFWPTVAQEKLLSLPLIFHETNNTGENISRINKGCIQLVQVFESLFWGFVPSLLYLIINIFIFLWLDWRIGLTFFLPTLPAAWIYWRHYRRYARWWEIYEYYKEKGDGCFLQSILNVKTVQAYCQEEKEIKTFRRCRRQMQRLDCGARLGAQKYFFTMKCLLALSYVGSIALGFYLTTQNIATLGTVVYVIATGNTTYHNLYQIIYSYSQIQKKLVAVIRMKTLLSTPAPEQSAAVQPPSQLPRYINLQGVSFAYPRKDKPTIKNVTLQIPLGKFIALVGESGAGKTTFLQLLNGLRQPNEGKIYFGDIEYSQLSSTWIRRQFAYVPQLPEVFDATLWDNITYAYPEAPTLLVKQAVEDAGLNVVLQNKDKFPQGLQTLVGERGVRLSGGERQRVAIAMALVAIYAGVSHILLLDEPTANLDGLTEAEIQQTIQKLKQQKISIIAVTHRLATAKPADYILVWNEGQVVEQGTHSELLQKHGLYAHLAAKQSI
ncbi:ABC transporter ATP-binding protein [Candidatus Parcubacteria bacterium]|nr:MAG: ABC transporter ATP-binding protein [Candidatus Parcubacteria bacterium]